MASARMTVDGGAQQILGVERGGRLTQPCAVLVCVLSLVELEQTHSPLNPSTILHREELAANRMEQLVLLLARDDLMMRVVRSAQACTAAAQANHSPSCSLKTSFSGSSASASPTFRPLSSFSFKTSFVDTLANGEAVCAE